MKQRLAIALAVMHDPELLILDEPINGLDPIGIAEVRSFIRELCDARGKTILISSHILSEISLLADDIGIIDHGALLEEESLAELEQKKAVSISILRSLGNMTLANLYPITASLGMVGYRSYDTAVNWNIGICSCSLVLAVVISAILILCMKEREATQTKKKVKKVAPKKGW